MSTVVIQDLPARHPLAPAAMARVRGGIAMPSVNVNVNLDQKIGQFQNILVNVLDNNAVIGADFGGAGGLPGAAQWGAGQGAVPV